MFPADPMQCDGVALARVTAATTQRATIIAFYFPATTCPASIQLSVTKMINVGVEYPAKVLVFVTRRGMMGGGWILIAREQVSAKYAEY